MAGVKYKDGTVVSKNIQLRFIDSCRFMASSLDELASNLCGTSGIQCDKCKGNMELINISGNYIASLRCKRCRIKKTKGLGKGVLKKNFNDTSRFSGCDKKSCLMIYPYKYMDCWKKFEETSLPPKDAFYSRLNVKGISDQNHEHAQQIWDIITPGHKNITLGDYHDVYFATDVLLLADVFETFQNTYLKNCKLDPAHFYTTLGLAWQALLKTAAEYCKHEKKEQRL